MYAPATTAICAARLRSRYDEYAQVVIDEGVKVVETAGSNPKKWITLFKSHGITTIHKCVTIRHALSAQASFV